MDLLEIFYVGVIVFFLWEFYRLLRDMNWL